jgi:SulP family sulfate permease
MYFVERGQVTVSLPLDGDQTLRLRSFGTGTIVGEMALYTQFPRSANVVCDFPTRVRRLSLDRLRQTERADVQLALQFHNFVIKVLAARLAVANEHYRGLL